MNPKGKGKKIDTQELELPDTIYIRDIDNRAFQSIVLQTLAQIEGISLIEGNFLDYILGRSAVEGLQGIYTEQDHKNNVLRIKVEIKIRYGLLIPEKAEEIQTKIVDEVVRLTGLHVASVHVVIKNVISEEAIKSQMQPSSSGGAAESSIEEEFTDEF